MIKGPNIQGCTPNMSRRDRPRRRSTSRLAPDSSVSAADGQRLQKVLAAAGIGSRRKCEQLILAGRVEVDRQVVTELGTRVDPAKDQIRVDGQRVPDQPRVYYLVNKPPGVVSTSRDPSGRPRVIDLVPASERLFTVGRLDKSSEGLILVTNDGELANRLAHPRYRIEKTYLADVAGHPSPESLRTLRRGVHLAEAVAEVARLRVKKRRKLTTVLELALDEGRNREIRRMLAKIGHNVVALRRIALGPLRLGDLPTGAYRRLTPRELSRLQRAVGLAGERTTRKQTPGRVEHAKPKRPSTTIGSPKETPRCRTHKTRAKRR